MSYTISIPEVRLRGLVALFLPRRLGFFSLPVYVGFIAGKVPLEQVPPPPRISAFLCLYQFVHAPYSYLIRPLPRLYLYFTGVIRQFTKLVLTFYTL